MGVLQNLTAVDVVFLAFVLILAVVGAVNGFVNEVFGKAAFVVGAWAAVLFHKQLVVPIERQLSFHTGAVAIAFVAVFVVVFVAVKLVQLAFRAMAHGYLFGELDRVLGFALGAVEALALVAVALIVMRTQTLFDVTSLLENSLIANLLQPLLASPLEKISGAALNMPPVPALGE